MTTLDLLLLQCLDLNIKLRLLVFRLAMLNPSNNTAI